MLNISYPYLSYLRLCAKLRLQPPKHRNAALYSPLNGLCKSICVWNRLEFPLWAIYSDNKAGHSLRHTAEPVDIEQIPQ